ncbi:MAG: glycosyltransferase [Planctomycetota bacterium]|nr:glycosyltransferase [Planctomycetota bacterium]
MRDQPLVSFVIASHDRRAVLLDTLEKLFEERRPACPCEVIVVDNTSTDGTSEAVRRQFPSVTLLDLRSNLGSCAKALGVDRAVGDFIVFLDDDSFPRPHTVDRMLEHFADQPKLGAASFRVFLPNGREECSAFPNVFIGCGVGFRARALREVGGLDRTLFMAAEEYDLSFRLINRGWHVRTFDDLHVDHLKTIQGRRGTRPVYHDARNNFLVAARYLPGDMFRLIGRDWMQRYHWLAADEGRLGPHVRGSLAGRLLAFHDRARNAHQRLSPRAFEVLFRFGEIEDRFSKLAAAGINRIVLADLGKNALAFHRAASKYAMKTIAIADDRFASRGRRYRGVPILPVARALQNRPDAIVISNTSPIHAAQTLASVEARTDVPVHGWFAACPARPCTLDDRSSPTQAGTSESIATNETHAA